jgi:hypothetical protein
MQQQETYKRKKTIGRGEEMEIQDLDWFIAQQETSSEPEPQPPTPDAILCFVFLDLGLYNRFCVLFPEDTKRETRPLVGVTERKATIFGEPAVIYNIDPADAGFDYDIFATHLYTNYVIGPICVGTGYFGSLEECMSRVATRLGVEERLVQKAKKCHEMFEAMRETSAHPDFDVLREFCHAIGLCDHEDGPVPVVLPRHSPFHIFRTPARGNRGMSLEAIFTPYPEDVARREESRRRRRRARKRKEPTEKELEEFIALRKAQHTHEKEAAEEQPETVSAKDMTCKICFDNKVNTVFAPCGHACACTKCCIQLETKGSNTDKNGMIKCPMCRQAVVLHLPFHL